MKRLQAAWQERDRLLRGEIAALEAELSAQERAHSAEVGELRERLAQALKRLKHAKQFVVPQTVRASLSGEIVRAAALIRDAGLVVKASRSHAEKVLAGIRVGGHASASEPAWATQVRSGMAAEASAATSFAEAAEVLAKQLLKLLQLQKTLLLLRLLMLLLLKLKLKRKSNCLKVIESRPRAAFFLMSTFITLLYEIASI